jgi:hypothetical protein
VLQLLLYLHIFPAKIKETILGIMSEAIGVDGISNKMLKPIIDIILLSLTHLFNYSLQNSVFPDL